MAISLTSAESAIIGLANFYPMSAAIAKLYDSGKNLNEYMNQHILALQQSENTTIATTGQILDAAKLGFGLGYLSSVALIAVGQLLLGNNLLETGLSTTVGNSLLVFKITTYLMRNDMVKCETSKVNVHDDTCRRIIK